MAAPPKVTIARVAKYIIEKAETLGLLQPDDTIVEASSGNTGNAMSMVAAAKGYRMLVVMPNGMSPERAAISRAFGAQVMTLGDFHVTDALAKVRELGTQPGYFAPQQFDNEWNVEENRTWLGPGSSVNFRTASSRTPWSAGSAPAARLLGWGRRSERSIPTAG